MADACITSSCSQGAPLAPRAGLPWQSCLSLHALPECKGKCALWKASCHDVQCVCAADDCFWAHEWSCHGSCSGWNQHDYFSNTIKLHNDNDIAVSLACQSICCLERQAEL